MNQKLGRLMFAALVLLAAQIARADYAPTVVSATYVDHFNLFPSGGGCPGGPLGGGCCEVIVNMNFTNGATSVPGGFSSTAIYYRQSLDPSNEANYLEPNSDTSGGPTLRIQFNKGEAAGGPFDIEALWDIRVPVGPTDNVGYSAPFLLTNLNCGPTPVSEPIQILDQGNCGPNIVHVGYTSSPSEIYVQTLGGAIDCNTAVPTTSFELPSMVPYQFAVAPVAGTPPLEGCKAPIAALTDGMHVIHQFRITNQPLGPCNSIAFNVGLQAPDMSGVTATFYPGGSGDGVCKCADPTKYLRRVWAGGALFNGTNGTETWYRLNWTVLGPEEPAIGATPLQDTFCSNMDFPAMPLKNMDTYGDTAYRCIADPDPNLPATVILYDDVGGARKDITLWQFVDLGNTPSTPLDSVSITDPEDADRNSARGSDDGSGFDFQVE